MPPQPRRPATGAPARRAAKTPRGAQAQRREIDAQIAALQAQRRALDPVGHPSGVFDPSAPATAARMAALAFLAQPRWALDAAPEIYGSGVYALYYVGALPLYGLISGSEVPLYVGKADPKDPHARTPEAQGTRLSERLRQHRRSVDAAHNLSSADFECRLLVVQSGLQVAAEGQLIRLLTPLWNTETRVCHGFGKHGDNPQTRQNRRSPWDTLHPGRAWARGSLHDQSSEAVLTAQVQAHLSAQQSRGALYATKGALVAALMQELAQLGPTL